MIWLLWIGFPVLFNFGLMVGLLWRYKVVWAAQEAKALARRETARLLRRVAVLEKAQDQRNQLLAYQITGEQLDQIDARLLHPTSKVARISLCAVGGDMPDLAAVKHRNMP